MTDKMNRWLTLTANIGVVIGLLLLLVELRQNTEMMQAQITQSRSESAQSENQAVFNSDHIPAVISKVRAGVKLSEEELAENKRWVDSLTERELDVGIFYLSQFICMCPEAGCEA